MRPSCNTGRGRNARSRRYELPRHQYNFSPNLAARLEWERYDELGNSDTGESDVNVFSLGLRLSF